jgi:hypothetical protein
MKKLILALLGAILVALAASTAARADCDSDPGNPPNSFE